jgi:hypothetical protein
MTKGTDQREPGFFIIDNEVVEDYNLGPYAGWLYYKVHDLTRRKKPYPPRTKP